MFQDGSSTEMRIQTLIKSLQLLVYEYVCQSLFKADRLMFALHLVHGMHPNFFQENVSSHVDDSLLLLFFFFCYNLR